MTLGNLGVLVARGGGVEAGRDPIREALALFAESDDAPVRRGCAAISATSPSTPASTSRLANRSENREMAERRHQLRCVGWTMLTPAELAVCDGAMERARPSRSTRRWNISTGSPTAGA